MKLDKGETVLLGAVLLCCVAATSAKAVQKREINPELLFQEKTKRPFCNAFTGCGRKRSDLSMREDVDGGMDVPLANPAVEARLWEDLLARIEDIREKQMEPMYYRGRRSVAQTNSVISASEVGSTLRAFFRRIRRKLRHMGNLNLARHAFFIVLGVSNSYPLGYH